MTTYYFTDTAAVTLTYTGETNISEEFSDSDNIQSVIDDLDTVTRETQWSTFFDTSEFVQFDATVAQPIVQPYIYDGELRKFKKDETELRRAQAQIDNLPWTMGHPPHDRVTSADQIRGFWEDPRWSDGQEATLNVPATDSEAVEFALTNDNVSIGFGGDLVWEDETDDYDARQVNYAYDHIASVENGRCPPEKGCQLHTDESPHHGHTFTDAVRTTQTEEMDTPQFSDGDWVEWDWSGGTAIGRVDSVHTEDSVTVSGTTRDPQERGEPVYTIDHWDENSQEFGNTKVAYESNVRSASEPEAFADASGCTPRCSVGPCSCGLHNPFTPPQTDAEVNGEEINLVPPEAAQNAAQQALDARAEDDVTVEGMTDHGWSRAEQLASGEELSPSDIVGGTGAMAPWWSRHETHTIDTSGDSASLEGADDDNPWANNSYTAGKGWGGVAGWRWALRKGDEIKRARGEDPTYTDSEHTPDGIYVEDGDWFGIAPSENPDDQPKYELNNCNDVKDAFNLRNNGDYSISTDTLVARIKRAAEAHDCPSRQRPWTDSTALLADAILQASN